MKIVDIKKLIENLPDEFDVVMEVADGSVVDFQIEPITADCDDPTIQGYILVAKEMVQ